MASISSVAGMLALLLVAVSLGLSNFAASVGIGVAGLDGRTRLRVALVFGARIGTRAGDRGEIIGGVVLIGVGIAIAAGVI